MDNSHRIKELRIGKKVRSIKKFYWFVGSVCFATFGMLGMAYFLFSQNASSTVIWIFAMVPVAAWIVVLIEYVRTFGAGLSFIRRWEDRQIQRYMEKEKRESIKYR